jgi:lipid-binding SYLF domain-containing protein
VHQLTELYEPNLGVIRVSPVRCCSRAAANYIPPEVLDNGLVNQAGGGILHNKFVQLIWYIAPYVYRSGCAIGMVVYPMFCKATPDIGKLLHPAPQSTDTSLKLT